VREARMEGERAYKAAVAAAQTNHSQSIAAARSESGRLLESARQDIGGALVEARRVLETQSRELAREAAARILGRSLS
jgi:F0F1-type ATP synthase membrane subunit b/b'